MKEELKNNELNEKELEKVNGGVREGGRTTPEGHLIGIEIPEKDRDYYAAYPKSSVYDNM